MAALQKSTAQRFSVIADDAPHLSARRQTIEVHCPRTGLIMLFTDVLNVGSLQRPGAQFSCLGCGETHDVPTPCRCRH